MLDKKLFKALRAGGLGHAAAALLANSDSAYYLAPTDYDSASSSYLWVGVNSVLWAETYGPIGARSQELQVGTVPLVANAVLEVGLAHYTGTPSSPETNWPDLSSMRLLITKVADVNGTPVAPVKTALVSSRVHGVVTLANSVSGFTVAHTSTAADGFTVTVATAGHYYIQAIAERPASQWEY